MRIPDWLTRRAVTHRTAAALMHDGETWDYETLWRRARQRAGQLAARGVHPGDRVAVLMRHGLEYALTVHAVIQAEAVLVPVNWRLAASEIAWQLADADVAWLLCDEACAGLAADAAALVTPAVPVWNVADDPGPPDAPARGRETIDLGAVFTIIYTSGTTGLPKGAVLTYGNFLWSAMGSAPQLGVLPGDRWLVPMPLFHVGGLSVLMRSVIYGTAAVIHDRFDPLQVLEALTRDRITLLSAVPTMLQRVLALDPDPRCFSSLRAVLLGGSAAPPGLLAASAERGIPVATTYGLTETTSQAATLMPQDAARKMGSSGQPLWTTEIRVVRDGQPMPPGEEGEIVVRGPTVTPGYWRRPDATAEAIRDGWLHTGDIGVFDADGFLYVLDRRSDLIVSGGENVYPAEVERVLCQHPAVAEAGVVGIPDPIWGHVPAAFVVLWPDRRAAEAELASFCRSRLAAYKVPKRFFFVDALPRNASGKLLRRALREWAQA
ncbi:2-succinylbenzoate--CoA ligase [Alicyclobacillus cellulosilyticus]|uniref:2-succinylbenzoate--CoA ligase n=1 Tax=Alicyclobacillus cellulosilyticus TaxID=1003997 RepID=A0A917NPQ4_9BACL|nr:o-succinylbenzoate--CoA ligase [Alicyclobacillus cellulosilyticus]GGJ13543.1 2-succinylbenzoate--CoA ligase [Alicyclobacillus cellulosilyticus]